MAGLLTGYAADHGRAFRQLGDPDPDRRTDLLYPDRARVIKGAMYGPAFAAYDRDVLIPEIKPGTAVILDNLATHRNKKAAAALKAHGCWFLYLPPYSVAERRISFEPRTARGPAPQPGHLGGDSRFVNKY